MGFTDQMGNFISLTGSPKRIISLVPSQTELLAELGLTQEVIGITKFCVHPSFWFKSKSKIGGTKKFDFEEIDRLHPDLIIGNKEENYQEGIDKLRMKYPVWMSDIFNLADALEMITSISSLVDRKEKGVEIAGTIQREFSTLSAKSNQSVLYLIWKNPWMAVGTNTFINDILNRLNLKNVISEPRYPELSSTDLAGLKPDLILLSSEPYPFKKEHQNEIQHLFPDAKILLVDGEMFSWYGSRLMYAPAYFRSLPI